MVGSPPAPLTRLLTAMRSRLLRQRWQTAVLWGVAVGAATGGLARLSGVARTEALVLSLCVIVATSCLSAYASSRRRQLTPQVLARLAENRLGLQQQFSTTLESPSSVSAVSAALHAYTSSLASKIGVESVTPRRRPTRPLAALSLGFCLTAIGATFPGGLAPLGARVQPQVVMPDEVSVDRVLELAESLDAEATSNSDPLLAALAQALRDLAADVSKTTDGMVTDRAALEDLLGTTARALGSNMSGAQVAAALAEGGSRPDAAPEPGSTPQTGVGSTPTATTTDATSNKAYEDSGVLDMLRAPSGATEATEATDPPATGSVERSATGPADYISGARDALSTQQSSATEFDAAAAIIGASSESSAGDSQLAGQGSQELLGEASLTSRAETADLVALTGKERDEGRRIEMELAPSTDIAHEGTGQYSIGAWRTSSEAALATDSLPVRYRAIAGRYFLPAQDTRGATADSGL